jgi:4-hydroxythreonine-4-phosphate dehydrogenase
MAFHSARFVTALVTTHLPLREVAGAITAAAVAATTLRLVELLGSLGRARARVVVAGLNPHAGEDGLLGSEEKDIIGPGMQLARERLAAAHGQAVCTAVCTGPMGAESAFRRAAAGDFDGVVAMYHDQATIACKLTGFGEAVNVTLGLPIVRTSVDHGTAYDLAGSATASDRAMRAALLLAGSLSRSKR